MSIITTEERLALLLNVLGDDVASVAFESMNPTRANYIQQLLADFQTNPPSSEEVDFVLGDFNQYFDFALNALSPQLTSSAESAKAGGADEEADAASKGTSPKITYFKKIEISDDPAADLNKLDAYQIAMALESDHPKTIALVAKYLTVDLAAKVLEEISDEARSEAIVYLTHDIAVPDPILNQILKSTVLKALSVECRTEEVDQAQVLAELMRSFNKQLRTGLMEKLTEEDEELAQKIKSQLYIFDDVLRLDDRDVQKILGEVETDSLIVGLQNAGEEITAKLLNNLSKRARETIQEEMQYKTGVAQEEIDQARVGLIEVIARLDESGDITLQ